MYFAAEAIGQTMKIAARYLVRLKNSDGLSIADYRRVRHSFREKLSPVGCTVNSTRISGVAIEIDFFSPEEKDAKRGIELLKSEGSVLSITDLMKDEELPKERAMEEALRLFNEERFWEVHETVEGVWRKASGEEKFVQQSIILYAAALVHYQKNEVETTLRMLKRATDKMKWGESRYLGFDLERMRKEAELMRQSGKVHIFRL